MDVYNKLCITQVTINKDCPFSVLHCRGRGFPVILYIIVEGDWRAWRAPHDRHMQNFLFGLGLGGKQVCNFKL